MPSRWLDFLYAYIGNDAYSHLILGLASVAAVAIIVSLVAWAAGR